MHAVILKTSAGSEITEWVKVRDMLAPLGVDNTNVHHKTFRPLHAMRRAERGKTGRERERERWRRTESGGGGGG